MVRPLLFGVVMGLVVAGVGYGARGADDATSPADVAMAFARAMDVGDAAGAKSYVMAGDGQTGLVDAMAGMTRSQQRLLKVATPRFGESAKILVGPYADPGLAATVGRSKVTVEGETALLRERPGEIFLKLRRVDGRWRVDVAGSSEAEARKREIPLLEGLARVCNETADRVEAGTYATAQEAQLSMIRAIRARSRQSATGAATRGAATRPIGRTVDLPRPEALTLGPPWNVPVKEGDFKADWTFGVRAENVERILREPVDRPLQIRNPALLRPQGDLIDERR